jgi:hypothetical protein
MMKSLTGGAGMLSKRLAKMKLPDMQSLFGAGR